VHFAADGRAVIAFWSGRVEVLREIPASENYAATRVQLEKPAGCEPPALFYSAFLEPGGIYATLYCEATIVRAPLP
jgi:hypothetical protein